MPPHDAVRSSLSGEGLAGERVGQGVDEVGAGGRLVLGEVGQVGAARQGAAAAGRARAQRRPASGWTRGAGAAVSDVDDGARERARDAVEALHLGDDQLAELVDVAGLGADDDVVGARDVLGKGDALDLGDRRGDLGGLADVGLDQDVGLDDHLDSLLLGCVVGQPTASSGVMGGMSSPASEPARRDHRRCR